MHCPVSSATVRGDHMVCTTDTIHVCAAHPNVQTAKVGAAISEDRFEIAGLTFECLQPFVKWRISFGGLLRHVDGDAGDDGLHFVRFNFL